ncbi:imidazole glycerol phosphate synthase subunit HisH [Clostridia bacterium OttesenSCG-928-F22]|nr:imidazole glycerol phosphate synthase subunit HisH [Clostridia bacterium OttesenSCG-928-F22]
MIAIVDYGMGNLHSVSKGLQRVGAEIKIVSAPAELQKADKIVLPGVGAFDDAVVCLQQSGMAEALLDAIGKGTPLLGICLGMQMLFEGSAEGKLAGLGIFKERILQFDGQQKVPHMGWNTVEPLRGCPLYKGIGQFYAYFVHSYYPPFAEGYAASRTCYGLPFASSVWQDNVFATQYHPEKSGDVGLRVLQNFSRI